MKKITLFLSLCAIICSVALTSFTFSNDHSDVGYLEHKTTLPVYVAFDGNDDGIIFANPGPAEFCNYSITITERHAPVAIYKSSIIENNRPLGNSYLLNYNRQKTC